MKKAKKTKKVPQQRTELDQIATRLRTMLRRDTMSIIEKGRLLVRSRELLGEDTGSSHGKWQAWLAENFDLSYRTALNYTVAATYVDATIEATAKARGIDESETVSLFDFANLSPTVLYLLADYQFDERVEAAILAEARERRVDEDRAWAIHEQLAPPNDDDNADEADDQEDSEEDAKEDPESEAILAAGTDPAVPPTAGAPPPPDFALREFDQAIGRLKTLITKPSAQFASTIHSVHDLENVESFVRAVAKDKSG
jgi:hypothetical protein